MKRNWHIALNDVYHRAKSPILNRRNSRAWLNTYLFKSLMVLKLEGEFCIFSAIHVDTFDECAVKVLNRLCHLRFYPNKTVQC